MEGGSYTTKNPFSTIWMFCLLVSHGLWWGFVVTSIWNWFFVDAFGFSVLRLPVAIVICLLLMELSPWLRDNSPSVEKGKLTGAKIFETTFNSWLNLVVKGGSVLLVAWIARSFM